MNQLDSLKKMCDHYPGGREAVAQRLGKSDEVLRKELSGDPRFKMGALDAGAIAEMCHEVGSPMADAWAKSVAGTCGGFIELPVRNAPPVKQDLRAQMASMLKECTDAVVVLTNALADERISDNELKDIQRELNDLFSVTHEVCRGAVENNRASKPAQLRSAA